MNEVIEVTLPSSYITAEETPPAQVEVTYHATQVIEVSGGSLQDDGLLALRQHVNDPEPHPQYDDLPSLSLLFENGII